MNTQSSNMVDLSDNDSINFELKDEDSFDSAASPSLLAKYSTARSTEILPSSEKKCTNGTTAEVECDNDSTRSPSPSLIDVPVKRANVKPANNDGSDSSSPPTVQKNQLRERCMYGARCYRKNPAHKQQYSHPNDIDWGADDKGPCRLGASCKKRDTRHLRDYSHFAAKTNKGKKRNRPADQDTSTDDEDSINADSENEDRLSQPVSNILTTKRVRKPVQRQPQPEDDKSDCEGSSASVVDPFLTDGSDNGGCSWKGTSDDSETD